jgi:hypothetical protein
MMGMRNEVALDLPLHNLTFVGGLVIATVKKKIQ